MGHVKAVVFDWAGTMVDFGSRAPVLAMQALFDGLEMPVTAEVVRAHMGTAKRDHVVAILAETAVRQAWHARRGNDPSDAEIDALLAALEPLMAEQGERCSLLIPGAQATAHWLAGHGIRIGSTTGYTRTMMAGIIPSAAAQGYTPAAIVCAGDTRLGRPAPFMIWRALELLGVWPVQQCVVIDDAAVGIAAGRNAGAWTVAVAASGNAIGLDEAQYQALSAPDRDALLAQVAAHFRTAGADYVIASVADLPAIIAEIDVRIGRGDRPGVAPSVIRL